MVIIGQLGRHLYFLYQVKVADAKSDYLNCTPVILNSLTTHLTHDKIEVALFYV